MGSANKRAIIGIAFTVALAIGPLGGHRPAVAYPTQPVRIIVAFPPGGPNDRIARPLADKLSTALGQPFVVENKGGANGIIGAQQVANAPADGHTLLFMTGAHTANASIVAKMPFDPIKDFAPVAQIAVTYGMTLLVRNDFPARDLAEFIAMAKRQPGKFTYGNSGVGNPTHVAIELFKSVAGVDILSIPYKGTGESISALLGGQIDMVASSTVLAAPYVSSGQMRALGITGPERVPTIPHLPTFGEQGYPDVKLLAFYGMWAPAATPPERVELLYREVKKALQTPEMAKIMADSGLKVTALPPSEFAAFLKEDILYQAEVNRRIGITPK